MTYALRLRPELLDDAEEAFAWHEAAATGLGHDFLRAYFAALAGAQRLTLLHRKVYGDFRRALLSRFPYALYFRVETRTVVVFLLIHGARDPAFVRGSLRSRNNPK